MGNSNKQQSENSQLESLPAYIYADCCRDRHYLTLNRAIDGSWTAGYVEFEGGTCVSGLALNGSDTVEEAVKRLDFALKRWKGRGNVKTP